MIIKKTKNIIQFKHKLILNVLFSIIIFSFGVIVQRYGVMGNIIIPYFKTEKRELNNFIKQYNGEIITVDISFDEYKKLEKSKNDAMRSGLLQNYDYVSCKINNRNKVYPAKIRIKGDEIQHIQNDKWSLRIKLDGENNLWGMKKFSIHHPMHRSYLNEWIFHKALKSEGIISLRYSFLFNNKILSIFSNLSAKSKLNKRLIIIIIAIDIENNFIKNIFKFFWLLDLLLSLSFILFFT